MMCSFTVLSSINLIKKMQLERMCLLNIYFEHTKGVSAQGLYYFPYFFPIIQFSPMAATLKNSKETFMLMTTKPIKDICIKNALGGINRYAAHLCIHLQRVQEDHKSLLHFFTLDPYWIISDYTELSCICHQQFPANNYLRFVSDFSYICYSVTFWLFILNMLFIK